MWWARFKRAYLALMASRWGYNVFGRVLPSTFFLLGFIVGLERLPDVESRLSQGLSTDLLGLVHELLNRFIGLCIAFLFAIRKRPIGKPSSLLGAAVALVATFYANFVVFFNTLGLRPPTPTDDPLLLTIAVAMSMVATCLLAVSFPWLGRHIGVLPEVRGLVTTGPYRYLRHPIYWAYVLATLTMVITAFSAESIFLFLLYYGLISWRAALEERALEEVFGEQYRRYRASTIGLGVPKLIRPSIAAWRRRSYRSGSARG